MQIALWTNKFAHDIFGCTMDNWNCTTLLTPFFRENSTKTLIPVSQIWKQHMRIIVIHCNGNKVNGKAFSLQSKGIPYESPLRQHWKSIPNDSLQCYTVVQFITKGKKDRVCFIMLQQLTQIEKQILYIHAIAMMVTREQGNIWILPIVLTKILNCQRVWRDGGATGI